MSMKAPQVHAKDYLVDMILDGRLEEATTAGILESEEHDASRKVGDTTLLNYLVKLEEYLDDHDIYAFDGWEAAEFVQNGEGEFVFLCRLLVFRIGFRPQIAVPWHRSHFDANTGEFAYPVQTLHVG